jgi:hypothetical protein
MPAALAAQATSQYADAAQRVAVAQSIAATADAVYISTLQADTQRQATMTAREGTLSAVVLDAAGQPGGGVGHVTIVASELLAGST